MHFIEKVFYLGYSSSIQILKFIIRNILTLKDKMKRFFKNLFITSVGLTLMFAAGNASAKTFKIGVENLKYYPHYDNNDGKYDGFAREILDAFAKSKSYKFSYKMRPVKRLYADFIDRQIVDFKYPDNAYWQGDMKKGKNIVYSVPVVSYVDGMMVAPENKGNGVSKVKKIGTVRGFTPWTYLDMINQGKIKVVENNSFVSLIKQTLKGRVSGAYLNVSVAKHQLDEVMKTPGALVFDENLPHTKSSYFLSTIKYPKVMKEFNAFMKNDRKIVNKIKNKYKLSLN